MMLDPASIPEALEYLSPESFYHERHRRIFRAMMRLFEMASAVDVLTLAEHLKSTGEFEAVGGWDYIGALTGAVVSALNIEHHARIVSEKAELRRLLDVCTLTIRDVYEPAGRLTREIISEAETRVLGVSSERGIGAQRIKDRLWPTFEAIEKLQDHGGQAPGMPTGLKALDRILLGLHAGQLTVVAARPSMGKTALALGIALEASVQGNTPTLFFSFEMTADELTARAISFESAIDLQAIRGGRKLTQEEHQRMAAGAGHLNTAPLLIDDSQEAHVHSLAARARRLHKTENVGLIVIDYLQLLEGDGDNRREQIDHVTRTCKRLARALGIPVVLLSQLSRGPESRADKRPMLSDLRESGGIEQDADNVVMIYRPAYYMAPEELAKIRENAGVTHLIVPKQRNGPTGQVKVHFRKECARFEDIAAGPEA